MGSISVWSPFGAAPRRARVLTGLATFSSAGLAARVRGRGRRDFLSPASEAVRAEDGVSASDLEDEAMSEFSEKKTAGTLCV